MPSNVVRVNKIPISIVRINGVVTERKKYSFFVRQGKKEYTVKLGRGAPVALKMNRPWFDWQNHKVVVDAVSFPEDIEPNSSGRVSVKLPAKHLFLISRFSNAKVMNQVMSVDVKRINFYLVTPDDPGHHFPTAQRPYIAGAVGPGTEDTAQLQINDQSVPVKLGFRYATMSGFSITQLEPEKTQVFLTGNRDPGSNEITASRVLFQPVTVRDSAATK